MGAVPPSDEWKRVDRGKQAGRFKRLIVNRQTLMFAFRVLVLTVRFAHFIKDLFDDG